MIGLSIESPPEGTNPELAAYLVRQLENIAASVDSTNDFDGLYKYPSKYTDGMLRYAYEGDDFPSDGFYQVVKGKWESIGSGNDCSLSVAQFNRDECELDPTKAHIVYDTIASVSSFYGRAEGKHFILGLEYLSNAAVGIGVKVDQLVLGDKSEGPVFIADGAIAYGKDEDGTPHIVLSNNGKWWDINMTQVG